MLIHTTWIVVLSSLIALSSGSPKKGLGFDPHGASTCDDFKTLTNISWWYDWGRHPWYAGNRSCHNMADATAKHVPMLWGWYYGPNHPLTLTLDPGTQALLGFNEPNHKEQSGITPEAAALHWPELEKQAAGVPLVSPSAAPCGDTRCIGNTIEWFDRFFKACNGCRVDYLATHLYTCNAHHMMSVMHDLYQRYGRKIWLTEFACPYTHDAHKQLQYLKAVLPQLEAADYIHRYAWFIARGDFAGNFITKSVNLLQLHSTQLTPLGQFYNSFEPHGAGAIVG